MPIGEAGPTVKAGASRPRRRRRRGACGPADPNEPPSDLGAADREAVRRRRATNDNRKERPMCRWLAYSGSPILLREALYEGPNSLVGQSLHSRLGAEPTNGDGFGVGWYGAPDTPGLFHSTEPAW